MRSLVFVGCVVASSSLFSVAYAQPSDPRQLAATQKQEALRLADEGMRLYDNGDFAGARERFERAEAIIELPTFTLQKGRSLERLGQWNEALKAYRRVAARELPKDAPFQHHGARKDAERSVELLAPKVPRMTIFLPAGKTAEIFVDGRSAGTASSEPMLVDPGEHVIEARSTNGEIARKSVVARVSESLAVELNPQLPGAAAPPDSGATSIFVILGYVGIGLSGVSLAVTLGTGITAINLRSELDDACPERRCAPDRSGDVDTYDALRWSAGTFLFAGAAFAGAGIISLLLDPERPTSGKVQASVGLGTATVTVKLP